MNPASRTSETLTRTRPHSCSDLDKHMRKLEVVNESRAVRPKAKFRRLFGGYLLWSSAGCAVVFIASGCLSRQPLVKQSFALAIPSVASNAPVATDRVLAVRRVTIEPPFDG